MAALGRKVHRLGIGLHAGPGLDEIVIDGDRLPASFAVREYITPNIIMDTSGGDPSTGGGVFAAPRAGDVVSFAPLLPPRMPPKDEQ